jgi:hypothetical protein
VVNEKVQGRFLLKYDVVAIMKGVQELLRIVSVIDVVKTTSITETIF